MRSPFIAGLGLAFGLVCSHLWSAGCCGRTGPVHGGAYGSTDTQVEADYRLTISPDVSTVTETFTRNGVAWEIDYVVVKP